jgi:sugar phosphate isomerase/epimerase
MSSITLDIGHLELAGVDSIAFVLNMPQRLIDHTRFVHMHHHNELDAAQDGMRQSIELLKKLYKCFVTESAGERSGNRSWSDPDKIKKV